MQMRWSRPARIFGSLGLAALLFAACGGGDDAGSDSSRPGSASTDPAASELASGGTLRFVQRFTTTDLFPDTGSTPGLLGVGPGAFEKFAIYDGLVAMGTDGLPEFRLADSMESTDNQTWQIRLREGLVFSDGTPFDAEAVKFNWDRIADPVNQSPAARYLKAIASWTVVDPTTLEVVLTQPNGQFPTFLANSNLDFIGSPTALQSDGAAFGTNPVGAGPFMMSSWQPGSEMTLVRNPEYHGDVYLDSLVISYVTDETQALNTVRSGGADAALVQDINVGTQASDQGLDVVYNPAGGGGYDIQFNLAGEPFSDPRARQAIALALDPQGLDDSIYQGHADPAIPLFAEGSPFYDEDARQPEPDPAAAQALFDELADEGHPVEFTLSVIAASQTATIGEWVQATLSAYDNVSVRLDPLDTAATFEKLSTGAFDAAVFASNMISPLGSFDSGFGSGGPTNWGDYSNPEVDELLGTARATQNTDEQIDAYSQVQTILAEDLPVVFLVRIRNQVLYSPDVVAAMPYVTNLIPDWSGVALVSP